MTTRAFKGTAAAAITIGLIGTLSGCYTERVVERQPPQGEVYVIQRPPPPPPHAREVIVASPGPEFVWIEGGHEWVGGRYAWVPGRWDRPIHPHAVWVRGDWHKDKHGYRWDKGHWK